MLKNREYLIRLSALKIRYRQAWKRKASSCELSALLSDIEKLEHGQSDADVGNTTQPASGPETYHLEY